MRQLAMDILIFDLGDRAGTRVRAVTLLPFPKAPAIAEGIFDLRGTVVPALDMRARLRRATQTGSHPPFDVFTGTQFTSRSKPATPNWGRPMPQTAPMSGPAAT